MFQHPLDLKANANTSRTIDLNLEGNRLVDRTGETIWAASVTLTNHNIRAGQGIRKEAAGKYGLLTDPFARLDPSQGT